MFDYINYDPKIHKSLPLYVIRGFEREKGSFAVGPALVTNQYDIDHSDFCPENYFVRQSDIDARDNFSSKNPAPEREETTQSKTIIVKKSDSRKRHKAKE